MPTSEPRFVIQCIALDYMGEAQWWSNDHGWTSLDEATVFTVAERTEFDLPSGALCWTQLPSSWDDAAQHPAETPEEASKEALDCMSWAMSCYD